MKRSSDRIIVSLQIHHPHRDLSPVCQTLGLVPSIIGRHGERRRNSKGKEIGDIRKGSFCTMDLGPARKQWLGSQIDAALDRLKPHRALLRRIHSSGGRIIFYIGWFFDGNTGDVLSAETVQAMADLRIGLNLQVYPADD